MALTRQNQKEGTMMQTGIGKIKNAINWGEYTQEKNCSMETH